YMGDIGFEHCSSFLSAQWRERFQRNITCAADVQEAEADRPDRWMVTSCAIFWPPSLTRSSSWTTPASAIGPFSDSRRHRRRSKADRGAHSGNILGSNPLSRNVIGG